LPSITPAYLYTFAALIAISSLLTFSFTAYTSTLKTASETNKLKNVLEYVAAESIELLTLTKSTNATVEVFLQTPTTIGEKQYWLKFYNDSLKVWIEGGLGGTPVENSGIRVYLPSDVHAEGYYIGGYGALHLKCVLNGSTPCLQLSSVSEEETQ